MSNNKNFVVRDFIQELKDYFRNNLDWKKPKKAEKFKEGSDPYDEYVSHFIDWEDPNLKGRD